MVERAADKVAAMLRLGKRADSAFVLFPQRTMALYAFRFTRQNDLGFAVRLLELNAEAYAHSWTAHDAVGNGYRDAGDTTRAVATYERALSIIISLRQAKQTSPELVSRSRKRSRDSGRAEAGAPELLTSGRERDSHRAIEVTGELTRAHGQSERVSSVVVCDVARLAFGVRRREHEQPEPVLSCSGRDRRTGGRSECAVQKDEIGVHTSSGRRRRFAFLGKHGIATG